MESSDDVEALRTDHILSFVIVFVRSWQFVDLVRHDAPAARTVNSREQRGVSFNCAVL
jgi:hypothetical protein